MGEVVSFTKTALLEVFQDIELVGTDLIVTKLDGTTVTVDLAPIGGVDQATLDAAIAAVVGGAPGALNTLDELAAALNDDANLATTLTNLITTVKSGAVGGVVHGAVAGTARPAGYALIHWVGSVAPANAIDNDVWTDTSA